MPQSLYRTGEDHDEMKWELERNKDAEIDESRLIFDLLFPYLTLMGRH